MASMHMRFELIDRPEERAAAFYAERARGGAALIVTGGYAPNPQGVIDEGSHCLNSPYQVAEQSKIQEAVHAAGSKIALQVLHAGRYAKVLDAVGPSDIPSPINPRKIHALTTAEVEQTIDDYVNCAALAQQAGFDEVEIIGSEGYLITTFCARVRITERINMAGRSKIVSDYRWKLSGARDNVSGMILSFFTEFRLSILSRAG